MLRPPHEINSDIPEYVSEAILWAMEMHPDERPSSIEIFHEALAGRGTRPLSANDHQPAWLEALRANALLLANRFALFCWLLLTVVP
jgi:hypothetical protein